jgi:hypothetical protein
MKVAIGAGVIMLLILALLAVSAWAEVCRGSRIRKAELGACRRNAPTSIFGGTKRIGRIEIVDPEPDARSHSSSQCRQTHYSDTLGMSRSLLNLRSE